MGCCTSSEGGGAAELDEEDDLEVFQLEYDINPPTRVLSSVRNADRMVTPTAESEVLYSPTERCPSPQGSFISHHGSVVSDASFLLGASNTTFDDITPSHIDRYVKNVDNRTDQLEMSFSRTGRGPSQQFESIQQLEDAEVMARTEIYATFSLTSKMILLAARRIIPTIRRRKKASRGILVVHHRDVNVDETPHRAQHVDPTLTESTPETIDRPSQMLITPPRAITPTPRTRDSSPRSRDSSLARMPGPSETLQVVAFSGLDIDVSAKSKAIITKSWDALSEPHAAKHLSTGGTYFRFVCRTLKNLDDSDRDLIRPNINRTVFKDEFKENGVPYIDIDNGLEHAAGKQTNVDLYTFIGVRTTYILPGTRLHNFTKELLSSQEYHRECQPGPPKVYNDCTDVDTVRFSKVIVRFVFNLTLQLRVSEITDPNALKEFEYIDGMVPAKVILMERTKRNVEVKDSTAKCKSFLLYYPVTGGVLVTGLTLVINRTIPRVVASIVNSFGGQGAAEAAETADKTRRYLLKKFGDSRSAGDSA